MKFDIFANKICLDMDGVLADFNGRAIPMFAREDPERSDPETFDEFYGQKGFWRVLNSDKNFFRNLEPMPDAHVLYDAVKGFNHCVITGIPNGMDPYDNQKIDWATQHFPGIENVYCCRAKVKNQFCNPGDILIDDRTKHIKEWEDKGGTYIVHTSAEESIAQLRALGVFDMQIDNHILMGVT